MRPRINSNSRKLVQSFADFSGGLNTFSATHLAADNEFVEATNASIDQSGPISKRRGFSKIVASLGVGRIQSLYLYKYGSNRLLLAVYGGKLYKYVTADPNTFLGTGVWQEVIIRRHFPQAVLATLGTSGAVGVNLIAATIYDYRIVAKDAVGQTLPSSVSRVTTGATAFPVTVVWDKVVGATGYDIYRNDRLLKSVGNVATHTDSGNDVPQVIFPPVADTTIVTFSIDGEFVTWNDRCYFTTGNGIGTFDGTNAQLIIPYVPSSAEITNVGDNALRNPTSSIHTSRIIKMHWERMFLAGDPSNSRAFYFTDLGLSPTSGIVIWIPGAYGSNVTTDNGEPITGVINFRDTLVIFTGTSIHTIFGKQPDANKAEPFILRMTNGTVGALSHRSITVVDNSVVFVSKLGIYALVNVVGSTTNLNVQYLSLNVEPTFLKLQFPESAVAVYHDHQYKVYFPGDSVVLRLYVQMQAWSLDTNPKANALVVVDRDLYIGDYTNGIVYKNGVARVAGVEQDCYNDDGVAIPFYFRTKTYDGTASLNDKKTRKSYLRAKQYPIASTVIIDAYMDYDHKQFVFDFNESTVLGVWTLGTSRLGFVDVVEQEIPWKVRGKQMYLTFTNNFIDQPVTIYEHGFQFKIKKI